MSLQYIQAVQAVQLILITSQAKIVHYHHLLFLYSSLRRNRLMIM